MTTDSDLHERYQAVLPSFTKPLFEEPISIDRGEGSYVYTLDGDRYLDFFGGILTTMIGHSHPKVVEAEPDLGNAQQLPRSVVHGPGHHLPSLLVVDEYLRP